MSGSAPRSRARILSGEWPPGHRIPFEHELTARYRCSRMTVSKALGDLVAAGLIERRRRAGSFVRRPTGAIGGAGDPRHRRRGREPRRGLRVHARGAPAAPRARGRRRAARRSPGRAGAGAALPPFRGRLAVLQRGPADPPQGREGRRGVRLHRDAARNVAARARALDGGRAPHSRDIGGRRGRGARARRERSVPRHRAPHDVRRHGRYAGSAHLSRLGARAGRPVLAGARAGG